MGTNEQFADMLSKVMGPEILDTLIKGAIAYYKENPEEALKLRDFVLNSLTAAAQASGNPTAALAVWALSELLKISVDTPSAQIGK